MSIRKEILERVGAKEGDVIRIKKEGRTYEGILMPHHEFSDENIVTIKLRNGYNIGVEVNRDTKIEILEKGKEKEKLKVKVPFDPKKKTISILGTGGTIACYVDYRTGAVHPAYSADDLAFSAPEIFDVCNVRARIVYQLLSENMEVDHWKRLAREIAKEFNSNAVSGVVVPHGTDTMSYTAAALSFMLKNLTGPVVLVGAQRSSDRPSSDAYQNLLDAALVASKTDIGEVVVLMHGESSDSHTVIHRGTKVRKMHTSRRDAFKSINVPPLGIVSNGEIKLMQGYRKRREGEVLVDDKMERDVSIVYFYPGMEPDDIPRKKGIVLMGTGLGHVSSRLIPRLKELIDDGTTIVMTSQCIYGRVNMNVYSTGRDLLKIGVIPCEDMLPEVAYVKLMWVLAHATDREEIKRLMLTNLAGEISERSYFA